MNIALAADAPFGDHKAFLEFLGVHELAHKGIARVMSAQGYTGTSQPLGDYERGRGDWMMNHYDLHLLIGRELNLAVPDLTGYDLRVRPQYEDWMNIHGELHTAINKALGITS